MRRADLMQWQHYQTEWLEVQKEDDPANTATELRNCFMEIIN